MVTQLRMLGITIVWGKQAGEALERFHEETEPTPWVIGAEPALEHTTAARV